MAERIPLTDEELEEPPIYSQLHEELVSVLMNRRGILDREVAFDLEDALLAALKPKASRRDFVELSMLAAGAHSLIRAVEGTWPNSRVTVSPFQNPESLGVSLDLIIGDGPVTQPSIASSLVDAQGKVIDPLQS